jgi:hypothetical protein
MSFLSNIQAILSCDNTDFKAKMGDAEMAVGKFDKQLKKFGLGFGGIALATTAFRAILDYARDLENPMDANLKRAKEFTENLDGTGKAMLKVGAQALGIVNAFGEWYGRIIAVNQYGEKQVALNEKIAKQTEETLRALEKDKQLNIDIAAIKAKTRDTHKAIIEEGVKQLDTETRLAMAVVAQQAAVDGLAKAGNNRIEVAKLQLAFETASLDIVKLRAVSEKEHSEAAKKEAEAAKKDAEDLKKEKEKARVDDNKEFQKTFEKLEELKFARLSAVEQEAQLAKELAAITKDYNREKLAGNETTGLQVEMMEKQNELAKLRGEIEKETTKQVALTFAEEQKQLEIEGERIRTLARGFSVLTVTGGKGTADLSQRELDAKITNLTRQISEAEASNRNLVGGQDPTGLTAVLQSELSRAKSEADLRTNFSRTLSFFGEQAAFRVAGSEDVFSRLKSFITPPEIAERTATGIEELNKRLQAAGFYPNG